MSLASLIAPFAALALLAFAGLGLASLVAPRAPLEAQAALAPLVAAATIFISSPIVLAGVSPPTAIAIVLGSAALVTLARARRSLELTRKAALPASVACLAIVLSAVPALKHGTWAAATPGNQDAYVWVSQARSLENGPPQGASSTTPDRVPYDLLKHEHWPTAIPVSLAELAAVEGVDPVHAYGVFAVVTAGLLALALFFGARGCLHWSRRRSAVVAWIVTVNGLVLLSSFYGWQAQLLVTSTGTLFVLTIPQCFERRSRARDCVAPALFAAAAVAIYGWTIAPFVAIAAAVSAACLPRSSVARWPRRRFVARLVTIGMLSFALGSVAIARAAVTLVDGSQHASATEISYWNQYAWATPADALGLVPRGPRDIPNAVWEVLAIAVAVALLAVGVRSGRSFRNPRGRVLVAAGAAIAAELGALAIGSNPYASLKLMAYSIPLLTLLALGPRQRKQSRVNSQPSGSRGHALRLGLRYLAPVYLFGATTAYSMSIGLQDTRPATRVQAAARAADKLPRQKVIQLGVDEAWSQVWLGYFLRDRPLAVRQPSIVFTGYSARDAAHAQTFDTPADFVIQDAAPGGKYIWRDSSFAISSLRR